MTPSLLRSRGRIPLIPQGLRTGIRTGFRTGIRSARPPGPPSGEPSVPPPGRRSRIVAAVALALGLAVVLSVTLSQCGSDPEPPRSAPWADGSTHGRWTSVFNGHGTNTGDDDSLTLSPMPAEDPGTTHAGLVVSTASYDDVRLDARMRTVEQLRTPHPNPWEVPWLVWAYTDAEHFYYITLKPNGWELGKRDPAYPGGQRFLATGHEEFPVGDWSSVAVEQRGAELRVSVGGKPLVDFTDAERPYLQGRVGAYTEDATVEFEGLEAGSG